MRILEIISGNGMACSAAADAAGVRAEERRKRRGQCGRHGGSARRNEKTASTGETAVNFEKAIAGMDETRKAEFRKAQEIAGKFGADLSVADIENGAAGVYQPGKVTINPNAENPVRQVLVHELTHHMETSGLYE